MAGCCRRDTWELVGCLAACCEPPQPSLAPTYHGGGNRRPRRGTFPPQAQPFECNLTAGITEGPLVRPVAKGAGSAPSYPMIRPTMIQASVAMTTLPAKTSVMASQGLARSDAIRWPPTVPGWRRARFPALTSRTGARAGPTARRPSAGAVMLDLMHPVGPRGRLGGQGWDAGLDKAIGPDAARHHGGEMTACRRPGESPGWRGTALSGWSSALVLVCELLPCRAVCQRLPTM
jgi:hypothetical protein